MEKAQQPHDLKTETCSECAANASSLFMNNSNQKICCLRKQINVSSAKVSPRMISQSQQEQEDCGLIDGPKLTTDNEQKCQIDSECNQVAIQVCSELQYRGCTRSYCQEHSGKTNLAKKRCSLFSRCSRDMHIDICSECSNDIISAKRKFFLVSMLLGALIFIILICMLHLILVMVPGICQINSDFCSNFHLFWHKFSFYDHAKHICSA